MKTKTISTIVTHEWWPEFRTGWTPVGYCDSATAWIGSEDDDIRVSIHGNVIGDDFLRVPHVALTTAGIEHDYFYHAMHSSDVMGFIAVRDCDVAAAIACLKKIGG